MEREDVRDLPVRELTAQLGEQLPRLVRDEVALARAELFARGKQAKVGGSMFAAAAVVGLGGWLAMVAAAIAGLAGALPVWASALIVGVALAVAARTLAELTARLAAAREPGAVARRLAARTRDVAARTLGEVPGKLAGQRGARGTALVAIPVLAVAAAVIVAYRRGYLPPG